jgi:hypothetical protein
MLNEGKLIKTNFEYFLDKKKHLSTILLDQHKKIKEKE